MTESEPCPRFTPKENTLLVMGNSTTLNREEGKEAPAEAPIFDGEETVTLTIKGICDEARESMRYITEECANKFCTSGNQANCPKFQEKPGDVDFR